MDALSTALRHRRHELAPACPVAVRVAADVAGRPLTPQTARRAVVATENAVLKPQVTSACEGCRAFETHLTFIEGS